MLECLSCLIFTNDLPAPRMIHYLAYLVVFVQKSISTGNSLQDHFCVLFWGSELAFQYLVQLSFPSLWAQWMSGWCYACSKMLKIIEPGLVCIRFQEKCTALQSTWMLGVTGSWSFLSLSVIDVGFFPRMVLPKLLIWKTVHWWMPKEKGVENTLVLMGWCKVAWMVPLSLIAALSAVRCGDLHANSNPQTPDSSLWGAAFSSSGVSRPGKPEELSHMALPWRHGLLDNLLSFLFFPGKHAAQAVIRFYWHLYCIVSVLWRLYYFLSPCFPCTIHSLGTTYHLFLLVRKSPLLQYT